MVQSLNLTNLDQKFQNLNDLKFDLELNLKLNNNELFHKDNKIYDYSFGQVFYSSLTISFSYLKERNVIDYIKKLEYKMVVLICCFKKENKLQK